MQKRLTTDRLTTERLSTERLSTVTLVRSLAHSSPPSFLNTIFIIFASRCMARLTLLPIPQTPQTLRVASATLLSSALGTVHKHRSSRETTAETIFSLDGEGDDFHIGHLTTPFARLGLIADPCQLHTGIHHYPILHDVQRAHDRRQRWYRRSAMGSHSCRRLHGIVHPTSPHVTSSHDSTQAQPASTPLPTSPPQSPGTTALH
jgi:hypothetical protein